MDPIVIPNGPYPAAWLEAAPIGPSSDAPPSGASLRVDQPREAA